MQVGSELLQGFLRPRGGQVEADKLQGGVPLQQHLTLMSGHHCWQGSFLRSARVLVGLLSCLSPGCLAVVGKEMIPHQLAGERLLKGGLRAQWGLKLATEERIHRRQLLLGRPSWELKKKKAHGPQQRLYRCFRVRPGVARQGTLDHAAGTDAADSGRSTPLGVSSRCFWRNGLGIFRRLRTRAVG